MRLNKDELNIISEALVDLHFKRIDALKRVLSDIPSFSGVREAIDPVTDIDALRDRVVNAIRDPGSED
jgi:hypothetical protein